MTWLIGVAAALHALLDCVYIALGEDWPGVIVYSVGVLILLLFTVYVEKAKVTRRR